MGKKIFKKKQIHKSPLCESDFKQLANQKNCHFLTLILLTGY